ncbi:MAG: DNA polymerase III subunit gamma/tau [Solobacterium sp.]|nr:DNA polymerase III subunit gamma/tau [Solobacterium sp.]MDY4641212.1 DNA polymerase III subunit gamma/tau [Erysipelotrichaceae bacterium]
MSYQVLYRTYRPKQFNDVVGQDYIVKTLKNAIKTGRIAHAYLFAGPRGTGKTTVAKIFARAINCENFKEEPCGECAPCIASTENDPDIIEMDAASNNSVDDIRRLLDEVSFAPIVGRYKVYIIDEVHMLSASAFNALLKTLEEPPAHVIFILATTDPQKIIPTILSRCQRYNFSKITRIDLVKRMKTVLNSEDLSYEDEALDVVASLSDGGMRDALSLLDQILSYNDEGIFLEDVQKIFGLTTVDEKINMLINLKTGNIEEVIIKLRKMYESGIDIKHLIIDLLEILKETVLYIDSGSDRLLKTINGIYASKLKNYYDINSLIKDINILQQSLEYNSGSLINSLELSFLKMTEHRTINSVIQEEHVAEKTTEKNIEEPKPQIRQNRDDYITFLAKILYTANKNYKVADTLIFNRLELYKYDSEKRKYFELLDGTEFFASSKDAIIVLGPLSKINMINDPLMNEDLYNFINNEFGIDKMIYGVADENRIELIKRYKNLSEEDKKDIPEIHKYELRKTITTEEKLRELFGDVRVE